MSFKRMRRELRDRSFGDDRHLLCRVSSNPHEAAVERNVKLKPSEDVGQRAGHNLGC